MVRTPSPSAGPSRNQQKYRAIAINSRMKNSTQSAASSSAITSDTSLLPQCKVKRNYACSKCSYYTQNPRSFLHHQKNEHAEKLKVYECSHCLYASKHSQKLQRHIQMVHHPNHKSTTVRGYGNRGNNGGSKPPLVPPVRIRVQRIEKSAEQQQLEKLVIVEDVDIVEQEDGTEMEINVGVEVKEKLDDNVSAGQDGSVVISAFPEDDNVDEDPSPSISLLRQQQQKNKYKQDKVHATFIRCSVCPFGSHSQTLVNRHEKSAHLKKKFFRCMKCNYVTHMRARYTKHVKYHTMPMIKCDDCDFRTPYKWNLDRHNRNHSSTAPGTYKCSHCSFSADIKQSLTVHETNHHVPPVGGVYPPPVITRRKYRVGASDAPGSSVDGTEIVTYETTKDGGIVEIMTETKSATPTASAAGSCPSSVSTSSGSKKTIPSTVTSVPMLNTISTIRQPAGLPNVVRPPDGGGGGGGGVVVVGTAATKDERAPAPTCRRPMPKLIPIDQQQQIVRQKLQQKQQRRVPTIIRLRPPAVKIANVDGNDYYNVPAGQSALSDFASLIDDRDEDGGAGDSATDGSDSGSVSTAAAAAAAAASVATGAAAAAGTVNRRPSSSSADSSASSSKCKTTSFFDKLKARVDETADLRCTVCRHESKCLSEFMRHQRTHDDGTGGEDDVADAGHKTAAAAIGRPENATTPLPLPPPPPPTAAELKSTRCQRCRKRCKTSTELVLHLATCRGTVPATAATAAAVNNASRSAVAASDERGVDDSVAVQQQQQHPMENKIFVWNTALVPTKQDEDAAAAADDNNTDVVTVTPADGKTEPLPDDKELEREDENEEYTSAVIQLQQQKQKLYNNNIRKEGKMYKTVFKCPHCTFWAATASRFHVHIVGHLNRKPFECSCCAYRSNWRWDITKHIRLKSARKSGGDESGATTHHGAKVLMTDETGRRNYSKYNRYLTVMEMDIEDGADKAAGGEFEDGKGISSKKSVGGGVPRKRRTVVTSNNIRTPARQLQTNRMAATGGVPPRKYRIAMNRSQQQVTQQENQLKSETRSPSPSAGGNDNRSKTVWKCKKCFFRDYDRLVVLNHVKAHYRRGDFSQSNNSGGTPKQNTSQKRDADDTTTSKNKKNIEIKKSADLKRITEKTMIVTERRKTKATPKTGTASNSLMLSTDPKSLMLYDDVNFLSCPLCDMTASCPGKLKEHMQCTHIPEETKYRCEYCPFWSEEKTAMLDHMIFAHEMDDGSVNTDVNSADVSYHSEQRSKLNSTSNNGLQLNDEELRGIDETGSSNDTTHNMEVFDNGNGDDTMTTANMEVVFESSNESMVVVECTPNFIDNDCERMIESSMTSSKTSEKSSYSSINAEDNMMNCEYDGDKELEDEQVEADDDLVVAEEPIDSRTLNTKTTKAATNESSEVTESTNINQIYECNVCWYFSTNRRDMHAHKQLHIKRGALYNCTQCVFNVTKAAVLYHHYRYGHIVEEPELRYPEDSIIRAGHKEMHTKNEDEEESGGGPPMVWSYSKENTPSFAKVYKCRYCPHTNRRRHNTVEHERMHSDHPEHQNHRQLQQRAAGSTPSQSPLHPCKRCTYVCNNAGVLASHVKVHSISYGYSTVGFYDSTMVDVMQIRALEYVLNLEKNLVVDVEYSESDTCSNQEGAKYIELDDPEIKFCSNCPARFFFISDLRCHIRFHKFRNWEHACDCCSFVARASSQVAAHKVVHRDEYTERTAELLASGYPVSKQHPRPSEYLASVNDGSPRQPPLWSSATSAKCEVVEPHSTESDDRRQRRTKRPRDTDPNDVTTAPLPPLEQQDNTHKNTKRRRKSVTSAIDNTKTSAVVKTAVSTPTPNTQVAEIVDQKSPDTILKSTKSYYVRPFTCDKCPGRFFKSTALQYHKTLHGGTGQYHCRECDYAVSTYGNLIRHEYVHKDLPPRVKMVKQIAPKSSNPIAPKSSKPKAKSLKSSNSPEKMPPPRTSKNTDKNSSLSYKTNNEDFPIDPEFGPSMLGNPAFHYPNTVKNGVARPKRYKCAKCPSAFDKRDQYAVHRTLHGAQDKYQCDKCDYSVKYTANYVQHQRKHARDAEIRKNIEQAADRAKLIKDQEEAARAPRDRQKPKSDDQQLQPAEPLINLDPHNTEFRNEISDRQTAYELNTAYGATGIVGNILDSYGDLFRCSHCPYECNNRVHLNQHTAHHQTDKVVPRPTGSLAAPSKRPWKFSCRFCTYRTQTENDLTEHTRVHFLRSTGATLSTFAATSTCLQDKIEIIQPGDYVEFHGKRVIYNQQENNSEENKGDVESEETSTTVADPDAVTTTADADTTVTADAEDKNVNMTDNDDDPFFMFKDCSVGTPLGTTFNGKSKKYCPDCPIPQVLIDYNDNRTSSDSTTKPQQQQQTTAFIRFIKGGKRLEFLDNGSGAGDVVGTGGKMKRGKK